MQIHQYHQVKAARYDGSERVMGNSSNVVEGTVDAANLVPTNVVIEQNDGAITLTWDKVAGMKGYDIYRRKYNGAYRHIKRTTTMSMSNTSLEVGSTYQYKIKAYTIMNGEKVFSAEVETEVIVVNNLKRRAKSRLFL